MSGKSSDTILLDMVQDISSIKTNVEILLLDREHARTDRKSIFDRIGAVESVKERVDRIEPIVDRLNDTDNQSRGAHKLGRLLWFAIATIAGSLGGFALDAIRSWRGH